MKSIVCLLIEYSNTSQCYWLTEPCILISGDTVSSCFVWMLLNRFRGQDRLGITTRSSTKTDAMTMNAVPESFMTFYSTNTHPCGLFLFDHKVQIGPDRMDMDYILGLGT